MKNRWKVAGNDSVVVGCFFIVCLFIFFLNQQYFVSIHNLTCSADLHRKQIEHFIVPVATSCITFYIIAVANHNRENSFQTRLTSLQTSQWPADLVRLLEFFFSCWMSANYDSHQTHIAPKRLYELWLQPNICLKFVCVNRKQIQIFIWISVKQIIYNWD